ncbi:MAG: hypothetical protein PVG49_13450 [Desulfobacteraceae bacterium]|jgi:hypothetical protein
MQPAGFKSCRESVLRDGRGFVLKTFAWTIATACLIPLFCAHGWAGVPELDREGIFCTYYSICGETPETGDIEDLCWALESPTFSAFKPAEMFSGNSLRKARRRLNQRIRQINAESLFRWSIEGRMHWTSSERARFHPITWEPDFPRATPYIGAEMLPEHWERLRKALKELPLEIPKGTSGWVSRVGVLLKPYRVEKRFQKRNIALEDVLLPIRCVVFVPVAIQLPASPGTRVIPIFH